MRNLKRVLSLVMAVAMLIGLMVVSASAASTYDNFTDKDEIVNKEAVNTMVSLGVINGKEDGSYFDPNGIVTRAEMAKLIAVTLNGGKDPLLGTGAAVSPFTDVASNYWAAPYIAYCANLGIINGKGDGTFGPEEPVTGTAAAKMMLTALGYRSDIEGLTGSGWDLNSDSLANKVGLYDDMDIVPSNGLSRDNTAQLIYNGVQADEVVYRNNYGEYSGVIYAQPINGTGVGAESSTVLHTRFNVDKVEGVVEATSLISVTGSTTVEGKSRLSGITVNGETPSVTTATYPVAIDSEYLGYRVVLYVKGLKDLAPNASSTQVVSEPIVSQDNTVVTTTGRLEKTSDVKDALKGSGIAVPTAGAASVTITEAATAKGTSTGVQAMPGVTQAFIDNNADGTVDYIIAKNPALAKINTYNKSTEAMNISGVGAVDFVDVLNPEDVAQGDYVLVYNYDDTYVLEKVETVSGVVAAYNNNATVPNLSTITIDGTKYGQGSGKNLAPDVQTLTDIPGTMQEMLDGTYTLYLDPNGNILGYVEDEGVIGNYAVITGVNSTGSTAGFYAAEVKVILADGTTGKYDVNLLASANKFGFTGSNAVKEKAMYDQVMTMSDKLVAYALDGSTITLINPETSTENYEAGTKAASLTLKNSTASYNFDTDGNLMADNKTVFFIKDKVGNYSVVSGLSNLPATGMATTGTSQAIYYAPTNTAKAIFATVNVEFTSNSNFAFIYNNYSAKTEGTDTIYTYPVVLEDGTISTLASKTDKGVSKTDVHEYQVSGNYVTFDNQTADHLNDLMVTTVGNGTITVVNAEDNTNARSFPVLANAKIWNVEDVKADAADSVFATSFQKYDKVALVFDNNGNVQTGFVYDRQDGVMTAAPTVTYTGDATFVDAAGAGATLGADSATVYWNDAAVSESIKLNVTLANTNQDVKVTVTKDGNAVGTASTAATLDPNKGIGLTNETLYTTHASTLENGGKVTVTITVSEDGYATRTIVHTIYVSAQAASEPTVKLVDVAGNGTLTGDGELTVNETAEASIADAVIGAKSVAFNITAAGGSSVTAKLDGVAYTSNTPVIVAAGEKTYTLEVEVTEASKLTTTYTYYVKLDVAQDEAAAGTVKLVAGAGGDKATISGGDQTLVANDNKDVTLTAFTATSADKVKITIEDATVKSATLQAPDGSLTAYTSGTEFGVAAEANGAAVSYILTVVTSETGKTDTTTVYTITFTATNP